MLCPGFGYLYVGRRALGLASMLAFVGCGVVACAIAARLDLFLLKPLGVWALATLHFGLLTGSHAAQLARREPAPRVRTPALVQLSAAIVALGGALIVVLLAAGHWFGLTTIDGGSAFPRLIPGDVIAYRRLDPDETIAAGDLVVARWPGSAGNQVVRVVGVPGEVVETGRTSVTVDGRRYHRALRLPVTLDAELAPWSGGQRLVAVLESRQALDGTGEQWTVFEVDADAVDADAVDPDTRPRPPAAPTAHTEPAVTRTTLAADELFVLSDARGEATTDSRKLGPLPRDRVLGRPGHVLNSVRPDGTIRWSRVGLRVDSDPANFFR